MVSGLKCVFWHKEVPFGGLIDFLENEERGAQIPNIFAYNATRKLCEIEQKLLLNVYRKMVSIFQNPPSWILSDVY